MPIRPVQSTPPSSRAETRVDRPALPARTRTPPATAGSAPAPGKRAHHKVNRTGSNWDANGDYIVGKGRPPRTTQWKKGQSGNPRGPKKREKLTAQAQFERTILAPFKGIVNGEEIEVTLDQFAIRALKNAAVKGSVKAAHILLDFYVTLARKVAEQEPGPEIETWEQQVIDQLLAELGLPDKPVIRAARAGGNA